MKAIQRIESEVVQKTKTRTKAPAKTIRKSPTGITGLDDLTYGGLPTGRPTLLCGAAGCGKTLFGMTFLVNGASQFNEPGVFLSFEERAEELVENVKSLGYDVAELVEKKKIVIDHVRIERAEIEESGEYDLEGLFVRLNYAIDKIGAKRVVLDTIEALFSGLTDTTILRAEIRRLFAWLKEKRVTAVITAERGDGQLTRYGIEEYVSDCVILLDNRVSDQITTRRLRVVKYRGSQHGSNEYPFLIDDQGVSVMPITSAGMGHAVSREAVPTGIADLDAMLGIRGYYRGSSILISGLAGTGKSTFAASFVDAACRRGERCLYFAFEESPDQIMRNMRSVGIDLRKRVNAKLLQFEATRPSLYGFEMHLARMYRDIELFQPQILVVDPISAFRGPSTEVHATLIRLADICKTKGITALFTSLSTSGAMDDSDRSVSSLMDTWLSLLDLEANGERNRVLYLLKSRGMNHSNQVREYILNSRGVSLTAPYIGADGVLTGSARVAQEIKAKELELDRRQSLSRRVREIEQRKRVAERQIEEIRATLESDLAELAALSEQEEARATEQASNRLTMAQRRGARDE